jgi:HPt (histidine-containing phosphotransfer) domain-containing protein
MDSNTKKIIDLNYLTALAKGNKAFVMEMVSIFLTDNPVELQALENGIKEKNFEKIKSVAHKLKSTLPFIGIDKLIGTEVVEIESLGTTQSDLPGIESRFKKVKEVCERAYTELRETKI